MPSPLEARYAIDAHEKFKSCAQNDPLLTPKIYFDSGTRTRRRVPFSGFLRRGLIYMEPGRVKGLKHGKFPSTSRATRERLFYSKIDEFLPTESDRLGRNQQQPAVLEKRTGGDADLRIKPPETEAARRRFDLREKRAGKAAGLGRDARTSCPVQAAPKVGEWKKETVPLLRDVSSNGLARTPPMG